MNLFSFPPLASRIERATAAQLAGQIEGTTGSASPGAPGIKKQKQQNKQHHEKIHHHRRSRHRRIRRYHLRRQLPPQRERPLEVRKWDIQVHFL